MEDTATLVSNAVTEATTVADTEPIPGDETPEAAAGEEPSSGAEASTDDQPEAGMVEPKEGTVEAPQKRRGPIPFDRHQAVLTKARNEAAKAQEALQKRIEGLSRYESEDHQAQLKFLEILSTDVPRAVQILKQADPERFGKLSWAEQQAVAAAVGEAVAGDAPAVGEKPKPDTLNPDGTLGYSAEAAEKLVEWRMAQAEANHKKSLKELEDRFSKDLSPIKQEREAREAFGQAVERQKPILENARKTWKGFSEHEAEIRQKLVENGTWSLQDAYIAVVPHKIDEARNSASTEARKKVIGELNAKGKAGGIIPGKIPAAGSSDSESGEPKSTADLVRAALRSAA